MVEVSGTMFLYQEEVQSKLDSELSSLCSRSQNWILPVYHPAGSASLLTIDFVLSIQGTNLFINGAGIPGCKNPTDCH